MIAIRIEVSMGIVLIVSGPISGSMYFTSLSCLFLVPVLAHSSHCLRAPTFLSLLNRSLEKISCSDRQRQDRISNVYRAVIAWSTAFFAGSESLRLRRILLGDRVAFA